jgi:hypothetical protein
MAYLVRAVDEHGEPVADLKVWHRRFVATAMFDSLVVSGRTEYNPNAFEILLNDDDEFASFQFAPCPRGQVIRVRMRMLPNQGPTLQLVAYQNFSDFWSGTHVC